MRLILFLIGWPTKALANDNPIRQYCEELHPGCGAGSDFAIQLAVRTVDIISDLIGAAAVVAVLWGAARIVASAGNDEGRNEGQKIILTALVGVFLALIGKGLVLFVGDFVGTYAVN